MSRNNHEMNGSDLLGCMPPFIASEPEVSPEPALSETTATLSPHDRSPQTPHEQFRGALSGHDEPDIFQRYPPQPGWSLGQNPQDYREGAISGYRRAGGAPREHESTSASQIGESSGFRSPPVQDRSYRCDPAQTLGPSHTTRRDHSGNVWLQPFPTLFEPAEYSANQDECKSDP
jgi:hypothetical protein